MTSARLCVNRVIAAYGSELPFTTEVNYWKAGWMASASASSAATYVNGWIRMGMAPGKFCCVGAIGPAGGYRTRVRSSSVNVVVGEIFARLSSIALGSALPLL